MDEDERRPVADGPQEREVVATLVENHRRFLAFLEKRLGSREAAEDVLQQAFVRGIERAGTVREGESAVAWFFRLLRNAVVDRHRAGGRMPEVGGDLDPELEPAAPDPGTETEICRCVLELARTLEPSYSDAIERVELGGMAVKDYAAAAGITANNAAVRLFRARAALAKRVNATCRTCAAHGCLDCTCGRAEGHG